MHAHPGSTVRNAVIGAGAFYASQWVHLLLQLALQGLAMAFIRSDEVSRSVTGPFVTSLSMFVGASAAGVATVWLVDSARPVRWTIVPAAFWLIPAVTELAVEARTWFDGGALLIASILPSIVCIGAGRMAAWHRPPR